MDRTPRHRYELPDEVVEGDVPEASPEDVLEVDESDELPEASPDDVVSVDERPSAVTMHFAALNEVLASLGMPEGRGPASWRTAEPTSSKPNVRKTFPLRLSDLEREEGKRAAQRMPPGSQQSYSLKLKAWTEADFWRLVGLDWANVLNALPAGQDGELPSRALKRLRESLPVGVGLAGVELQDTPAMRDGEAGPVLQCAQCGLLVCTSSLCQPKQLGPCPACSCSVWRGQTLPVGPFVPAARNAAMASDAAPHPKAAGKSRRSRGAKRRAP